MGAAAGLQVDQGAGVANADGAHAATAARRLHRHAFDQRRVGVELGVADLAHHKWQAGRDQPRQAFGEDIFVQRIGHAEVHPGVVGRD